LLSERRLGPIADHVALASLLLGRQSKRARSLEIYHQLIGTTTPKRGTQEQINGSK
jgi:hypothetical protein